LLPPASAAVDHDLLQAIQAAFAAAKVEKQKGTGEEERDESSSSANDGSGQQQPSAEDEKSGDGNGGGDGDGIGMLRTIMSWHMPSAHQQVGGQLSNFFFAADLAPEHDADAEAAGIQRALVVAGRERLSLCPVVLKVLFHIEFFHFQPNLGAILVYASHEKKIFL
jgi:hypothetical protein